jgi:hypothetical protein
MNSGQGAEGTFLVWTVMSSWLGWSRLSCSCIPWERGLGSTQGMKAALPSSLHSLGDMREEIMGHPFSPALPDPDLWGWASGIQHLQTTDACEVAEDLRQDRVAQVRWLELPAHQASHCLPQPPPVCL